jgi:TonB family protein
MLAALSLHAQQTLPPVAAAVPASELEPMIFCDGKHVGELQLFVDIDSAGQVSNATVESGDARLQPLALGAAKLLRHGYASKTGVHLHVSFVDKKTRVKVVEPEYPAIAKAAHVSGTVELVATVTPDGSVSAVVVTSGPAMLGGTVADALKKWTFPPALQDGHAVLCHAVVVMNFNLRAG